VKLVRGALRCEQMDRYERVRDIDRLKAEAEAEVAALHAELPRDGLVV
jgi:hypothetical protein